MIEVLPVQEEMDPEDVQAFIMLLLTYITLIDLLMQEETFAASSLVSLFYVHVYMVYLINKMVKCVHHYQILT